MTPDETALRQLQILREHFYLIDCLLVRLALETTEPEGLFLLHRASSYLLAWKLWSAGLPPPEFDPLVRGYMDRIVAAALQGLTP